MKTILFSLVASLALATPAMAQDPVRTAPFSEVIAKVEAITAANKAVEVANKIQLELTKGSSKKIINKI